MAINACAARPAGADKLKALDFDVQAVQVVEGGKHVWRVIGSHWGKLGKDGYVRWVDANGKTHALTRAQKRMTFQRWINMHGGRASAVKMLRKRNGDTVLYWEEAVSYARAKGVVLCPELKSRAFALYDGPAQYMAWVCKRYDYPLWSMALLSMWGPNLKCARMRKAGGQFALIFGRFRLSARGKNKIAGWSVKPNQIWGPASAKAWLR